MVEGDRVSFLAFGDWGRCADNQDPPQRRANANCERQRGLAAAMEDWAAAAQISFLLSTGDQFYEGPLSDLDERYQYSWREVYTGQTLRTVPWYMIHGSEFFFCVRPHPRARASLPLLTSHHFLVPPPASPILISDHDYTGELGAQVGWGERAPVGGHDLPDGGKEEWDVRWRSPSLNFTLRYNFGAAGSNGACLAMVLIDTVSEACALLAHCRAMCTVWGTRPSPSTTDVLSAGHAPLAHCHAMCAPWQSPPAAPPPLLRFL